MRRTSVLVTLAAAAVATGLAVPALATSGSPPTTAFSADAPGTGSSVLDWNRRLITILGTPGAQPASVHPTRSFAMLQVAEYDAVVAVTQAAPPYRPGVAAPAGARPDAAADQAAHDVLLALYPAARPDLDAQLQQELTAIPDGRPEQDGTAVGAAAAQQVLNLREGDGSAAAAPPYVAGTAPGDYRPTPPKNAAPTYTTWGAVTPFVLADAQQFRPTAPPAVTDPAYAAALDEVASLGRDTSTTRTPDQTVAGRFWSSAPIWTTWNQVAQQLATGHRASLTQATASFATLDLALADTTIAMYDAKYTDRVWRPVTAIRVGGAGRAGDPAWTPLTPTAADPSYPGAHSALSSAAAAVLTAYYGPRQPVDVTSAADPGVTRRFATLADVADEAALSRIWAGQHTRLDDAAGRQLGRQVAGAVLDDLQVHRADG